MKKTITLILALLLAFSLLTGCGASTTSGGGEVYPQTEASGTTVGSLDTQEAEPAAQPAGASAETNETAEPTESTEPAETPAAQPAETPAVSNPQTTKDSALETALKDAGFTQDQVQHLVVALDQDDDDGPEYDICFIVDGTEYEYEIDANTGSIRSRELDRDDDLRTASANVSVDQAGAEDIALQDAGVAREEAQHIYTELDLDDDGNEYEVTIWAANVEYEYEIDANTGAIRSKEVEDHGGQNSAAAQISREEAISAALAHAGVTQDQVTGLQAELDEDDGQWEYEVEFHKDRTEYDYEISASTGEILSYDADMD